ncbi:MAG TPA: T9SS type A sorting domain-containing protein [Bacteroidia bacterium]|jgi:hypothetical protein
MKIIYSLFLLLTVSIKAVAAGCTPPVVTSGPANAVVCENSNTSFMIVASDPGVAYQWQVDQGSGFINLSNVLPYSGVTTDMILITGATAGLNNYTYRCIVTNGCAPDDTSTAALLKVNVAPGIAVQPSNTTVCEGGTASFGVTTSGSGLNYQWQVNTGSGFVNVPTGLPYSGDTTGTLYITGAPASMSGYLYQCIVGGACAPGLTSASAALTINAIPDITVQPNFVEGCEGNNVNISIIANGTGISYQWQLNSGSGYSNLANAAPYSGVNTNNLFISAAAAAMDGYQYQCIVSGSCVPADTSYEIPLLVHPTFVDYISQTICQGDSYFFGTSNLSAPGFYSFNYPSVNACDSLVYLSLSVSSAYYTTTTSVICDGDSILIGGNYETTAGMYTYILPTISGCDSTIENTLTVSPSYSYSQSSTICQGDSALIFGAYEMMDSVYTASYSSYLGCDSMYTHTLIVKPSYAMSLNVSICQGDSALIGGSYESLAGTYVNNYVSVSGCDSAVSTVLILNPQYSTSQSLSICSNDSILLGGAYQNTAGVYTDVLASSFGCDSIVTTTLSINPAPVVGFEVSLTVCDTAASFVLTGGSPAGGVYSGPGVSSGSFSPGAAGPGTHGITYTYTDGIGCSGAVTNSFIVTVCSGIEELDHSSFSIFPNPFQDEFTVVLAVSADFSIVNVLGELVYFKKAEKGSSTVSLNHLSDGIYFIQITAGDKMARRKIVKR